MINFKFPKKLRLLSTKDFHFVFQQPIRNSINQIMLLGRFNRLCYPRIGIIVAKKYIKYSHDRNYVKRLVRESFRLNQHIIMKMDFIFLIKKKIINLDNNLLLSVLEKLWCYYHHTL